MVAKSAGHEMQEIPKISSQSEREMSKPKNNEQQPKRGSIANHQQKSSGTATPVGSQGTTSTSKGTGSGEQSVQGKDQAAREKKDLSATQASLAVNTEAILRRIRRLQSRQTVKHTEKQLRAFVKSEQIQSGIGCYHVRQGFLRKDPPTHHFSGDGKKSCISFPNSHSSSAEERIKMFSPEGVKSLSTSALVNLVKKLESGDSSGYGKILPRLPNGPKVDPTSFSETSLEKDALPKVELALTRRGSYPMDNLSDQEKLERQTQILSTVGTLSCNLRHLETDYDSDATESSSGGESCDELDEYYDQKLGHVSDLPIPLNKRANWKWCSERGMIASKWTWLQAQVADLEFRIRQQNEMYRQLRANKGPIAFCYRDQMATGVGVGGGPPPVPGPNNTDINPSCSSDSSQDVNSSIKKSIITTPSSNSNLVPEEDIQHCVRTLPLKQMRKRKLVRSVNALSGATRKLARHSTVQCICNSLPEFVSPCVLCNGRHGYLQVIDTDCMPQSERIALLDCSCHSVLSLNNDLSLGLHFSRLLKKETIQKPLTGRQQGKKRGLQSAEFPYKFSLDGRKGKKSQAVISSSKLRKKYDGTVKRKYSRHSTGEDGKKSRVKNQINDMNVGGDVGSRNESPTPGAYSETVGSLVRRRRSEQHAYDINNIVIPYSIASTTRVEKLQYKEIITPKWREVTEDNFTFDSVNEVDEEMSDEAFANRHLRSELEERKRFGSVLKMGSGGAHGPGRGRWSRTRLDSSRSDGALSNGVAGDSNNIDYSSQDSVVAVLGDMVASPGIAEVPPISGKDQSQEPVHGPPAKARERHRTSSSSKREDSVEEEYEEVMPYDKRSFPLPDVEYKKMVKAMIDEPDNIEKSSENIPKEIQLQEKLVTKTEEIESLIKKESDDSTMKEDVGEEAEVKKEPVPENKLSDSLISPMSSSTSEMDIESDPEERKEDPEWEPPQDADN